jgi:hypothetical protein
VNCETRQERIERALFEDGLDALPTEEREHFESCALCAAQFALLQELIGEADREPEAPLPLHLRAAVHARALRALRANDSSSAFRWDVAAPLAVALLAVPIAIGQGWLWTQGVSLLLEPWVSTTVLTGLTVFYAASAALTLGGLYALLPFAVAHANRNRLEVSWTK